MIYTKDGLSKEKLIELLQYSLQEECMFIFPIKPDTNIVNDHVFQKESVIRILKIEEKVNESINVDGESLFSYAFSVKILVEDKYWKKPENKDGGYVKSACVPQHILNKVAKILNS